MNLLKTVILLINFISITYMLYYVLIAIFAFREKRNEYKNNIKKKEFI